MGDCGTMVKEEEMARRYYKPHSKAFLPQASAIFFLF